MELIILKGEIHGSAKQTSTKYIVCLYFSIVNLLMN